MVQYIRTAPYGELRQLFDKNGVPLLPGGAPRSPYVFTDQERDAETGLLYFGARFYDPQLALFLTFDPQAQFDSPYSYTDGNPVNWTDPDGECSGAGWCPSWERLEWGFGGWDPWLDPVQLVLGFVGTPPFVYDRDDSLGQRDRDQGVIERSWLGFLRDVWDEAQPEPVFEDAGVMVAGLIVRGTEGMSPTMTDMPVGGPFLGGGMVAKEVAKRAGPRIARLLKRLSPETHHLLPREFKWYFRAAGLNIDDLDFLVKLPKWLHTLKPYGIHTGPRNWNKIWREFIADNPNPWAPGMKEKIEEKVREMLRMYGI